MKTNIVEYKGLVGQLKYDHQDKTFYGTAFHNQAVLSFAGRQPQALQQSFRAVVDDYLTYCQQAAVDQ